jgi:hypothetical protein
MTTDMFWRVLAVDRPIYRLGALRAAGQIDPGSRLFEVTRSEQLRPLQLHMQESGGTALVLVSVPELSVTLADGN